MYEWASKWAGWPKGEGMKEEKERRRRRRGAKKRERWEMWRLVEVAFARAFLRASGVICGVTVETSLVLLFPLIFGCVASRSACERQSQLCVHVRRTRLARNSARYEFRRIIALISQRTFEQGRCCTIDRSRVSLIIYRDNTLIRSRMKERTGNLLFNFTWGRQNDRRIKREPGGPDCNFSIKR